MSLTYFRPRGDTKANWESANPVLKIREMGIEWETEVGVGKAKIKFGDGISPWNDLDYAVNQIEIADSEKAGIVKSTEEITVEEDGGLKIGKILDKYGVVGEAQQSQLLTEIVDTISNKVMNELMNKTLMSNVQVNSDNNVPTSGLVYEMNQQLSSLNAKVFHNGIFNSIVADSIVAFDVNDFNNPPGAIILITSANPIGMPNLGGNTCMVIQQRPLDLQFTAQFAFSFANDRIGLRRKYLSDWTDWHYINFS